MSTTDRTPAVERIARARATADGWPLELCSRSDQERYIARAAAELGALAATPDHVAAVDLAAAGSAEKCPTTAKRLFDNFDTFVGV